MGARGTWKNDSQLGVRSGMTRDPRLVPPEPVFSSLPSYSVTTPTGLGRKHGSGVGPRGRTVEGGGRRRREEGRGEGRRCQEYRCGAFLLGLRPLSSLLLHAPPSRRPGARHTPRRGGPGPRLVALPRGDTAPVDGVVAGHDGAHVRSTPESSPAVRAREVPDPRPRPYPVGPPTRTPPPPTPRPVRTVSSADPPRCPRSDPGLATDCGRRRRPLPYHSATSARVLCHTAGTPGPKMLLHQSRFGTFGTCTTLESLEGGPGCRGGSCPPPSDRGCKGASSYPEGVGVFAWSLVSPQTRRCPQEAPRLRRGSPWGRGRPPGLSRVRCTSAPLVRPVHRTGTTGLVTPTPQPGTSGTASAPTADLRHLPIPSHRPRRCLGRGPTPVLPSRVLGAPDVPEVQSPLRRLGTGAGRHTTPPVGQEVTGAKDSWDRCRGWTGGGVGRGRVLHPHSPSSTRAGVSCVRRRRPARGSGTCRCSDLNHSSHRRRPPTPTRIADRHCVYPAPGVPGPGWPRRRP